MKRMSESLRTRVNLLIATTVAFAFGLSLASALDLTPVSIAAEDRRGPEWVIGAPGGGVLNMASGFADVADRVAPTVVTIYAEGERDVPAMRLPFPIPRDLPEEGEEEGEERAPRTQIENWSGSGFVISDDGFVVTNNHVVTDASRIDVELSDGRRFNDVELVGRDPQTDVALLKVDARGLDVLPIGSSDDTRVGEWVLAIGSPGFPSARPNALNSSVTAGIVSAKGRGIDILRTANNPLAIEDFIQTDAVINRGNSGGPLVNAAGEVIGINTAIFSTTGFYQGYGFAVPIELAREVVDDLIEFGEVRRALIGVAITDVTAADAQYYGLDRIEGAVVGNFSYSDESPARQAGIAVGDVIVGIEGVPISGVSELQRRIRAYDPGETVTLDIVRRSTKTPDQARVKLMPAEPSGALLASAPRRERPEPEPVGDRLGIEVKSLEDISRAQRRDCTVTPDLSGVLIAGGDRRGPMGRFFRGAFPSCAIIADVNGEPIETVEDYDRVVAGIEPGEAANVIYRLPTREGWSTGIASVVIPER